MRREEGSWGGSDREGSKVKGGRFSLISNTGVFACYLSS